MIEDNRCGLTNGRLVMIEKSLDGVLQTLTLRGCASSFLVPLIVKNGRRTPQPGGLCGITVELWIEWMNESSLTARQLLRLAADHVSLVEVY